MTMHEHSPMNPGVDDPALSLLTELVCTPSVSGQERQAVEVFVRHARGLGLHAETDAAGNGLAVRLARGAERRRVVLLGHIDTVPGKIPVRVEQDLLFGRGSVDAKGPLAAMLVAASRARLPEGVTLEVIAAVGEETPTSPGARHAVKGRGPDACIIGEPSGHDGVTLGYKGRLLCHARCQRDGSHSAGPDESPADILARWWERVRSRFGEMNLGRRGVFESVQATIQSCHSGSDGLSSFAEFSVGLRLPGWLAPAEAEAELRSIGRDLPVSLAIAGAETAYATDRNDPVVRALTSAIRAQGLTPRHKLKTGTADLNVVAPIWQCPIAAYGPGDSALDHTPEERLSIAEYRASIEILSRALESLAVELLAAPADTMGE
jgi:LysW-gamma-L-lysine carboxypeptidase